MNIEDVIKDINAGKNIFDVGKIVNISDFVVEVIGLDKAFYYEKINLADKAIGYVTEIKPESCMIAILKKNEELVIGDEAKRTNEIFQGYFSSQALGRMINILKYQLKKLIFLLWIVGRLMNNFILVLRVLT